MPATAISGEASRGRRAEKMPSGTPSATAARVEPATSSTCCPRRLASSARCAIQKMISGLMSRLRAGPGFAGYRGDGIKQAADARVGGRRHRPRAFVGDQPAVLEDADAIGKRERLAHVVGDDDHGFPQT